jgi:hypothetical protein
LYYLKNMILLSQVSGLFIDFSNRSFLSIEYVTSSKRKSLVLFAQMVQAIGCGRLFPSTNPLSGLNSLIQNQNSKLSGLLDTLSNADDNFVETDEPFTSKETQSNSLTQLALWLESVLESNPPLSLFSQYQVIFFVCLFVCFCVGSEHFVPSFRFSFFCFSCLFEKAIVDETKKCVKEYLLLKKTSLSTSGRTHSGSGGQSNSSSLSGSNGQGFSSRLVHQKEQALQLVRHQIEKLRQEKSSLEAMLIKLQKEKEGNSSVVEQCQEQIKSLSNEIDKMNNKNVELLAELERAQQAAAVEQEFKQLKQQIKRMNEEKTNLEAQLNLLKQEPPTNDVKSTISALEQLVRTFTDTVQKISLRLIQINSEIEKHKQQQGSSIKK